MKECQLQIEIRKIFLDFLFETLMTIFVSPVLMNSLDGHEDILAICKIL